ncbi:MAG: Holliday junction branch migration protein RuvA [Fibrobacter sp.]|jgi:Holliday junction DNA helicase RuvA|nr:Holliday junction branch migration protein RuvA [Fibrobacter sp.]
MIEQLRGILIQKHPTFAVVDCGGVGYGLQITTRTSETLPPEGSEATLMTHLVVREDSMTLFGFAAAGEKELFLQMIEVNGIGPKMAQRILSSVSPQEFLGFIAREDRIQLGKIKGIGKKTAEMLLLALKDKAQLLSLAESAASAPVSSALQEAHLALISLGVKDPAARKAAEKAFEILGKEASASALIPEALKHV